jgi:hypothetical protein
MLLDLRDKLRARCARLSSCGQEDFFPLSKQFFAFLNASPLLRSMIAELLARNADSVKEAQTVQHGRVYGETQEKAAAIAHTKWQSFAAQTDQYAYVGHVRQANAQQALEQYRDWYVKPLFEYLDEALGDRHLVLAMLTRYKHKVEWYRRGDLLALYENDTRRGEKNLSRHMYEFLFDQGLEFHIEPATASGRPDLVSLDNTGHPFPGDVKIFDPERSRTTSDVIKGFYQAYRYCWDYNASVGYLIVFNASGKQLRVELPSASDGVPRFEYNHKTIFLTVIDIHEYEGTASTLGVAETVTITADELIREIEKESSEAGSLR